MGNDGRIEKTLIMVNAASDPNRKRHSVAYFEDMQGNRYEYSFTESMTENTRSKFFKAVKPFEYFPSIKGKNNKPVIKVSFRPGKTRYNPLVGKYITQMLYPVFGSAEEKKEEIPAKPRVFKKYYNS